jgi:hypothetical protein
MAFTTFLSAVFEVPDSPFHLLGLLSTYPAMAVFSGNVHCPFHDRQGWLTFCSVVSLHGLGMLAITSLSVK